MNLNPTFEPQEEGSVDVTTPNGKEVSFRVHDADTLYSETGQAMRIPGINAAEVSKITETGGFSAGSQLGSAQTEAAKQIIPAYGFNKQVDTGKTDIFGRSIMDLANDQGDTYSAFAVRNRLVQPTMDTPDEVVIERSFQIMQDAMNVQSQKPPVQKARELVDEALSAGSIFVRPQANTIMEYQDYVGATSNKGLAEQESQIKALEKRLQSPKINDQQRQELSKQLTQLKDYYQANLNLPKNLYLNSIEGINSKTYGEASRAWDHGLINVKNLSADILEWAGDVIDSDDTIESARKYKFDLGLERRKIDLGVGDKDITGGTLTTLDDVQKDFTKIFRYIGTTSLLYGPQMGVMIGGSIVGVILGGAAGATVVPVLMGVGGVYGEMPEGEKDPWKAAAIGSVVGVIDKMGISKGLLKPADLLTKEGLKNAIPKIAAAKNISEDEAMKLLHKSMVSLGKDYAVVVKNVAVDQLKNKQNLIHLINDITKKAGKEAATEAVQEAIQYVGITETTSKDFDWKELYDRVKESAAAGGILGAEFSVVGSMYDRSSYNYELNRMAGIETKPLTANTLMEKEEIANNGYKLDDLQLAGKLRGYSGGVKSLDELKQKGGSSKTIGQRVSGLFKEGGLFKQTRDNILAPFIKFQGGREIAGLFDALSVRGVYAGVSAFKRIHALSNGITSLLPSNETKQKLFGTIDNKVIGARLLQAIQNKQTTPEMDQYRQELDNLSFALKEELVKIAKETGYVSPMISKLEQPDFFLNNQLVNSNLVRADRQAFIDTILKNYKSPGIGGGTISRAWVEDLVDRIINNPSYKDMLDLESIGMLDNPVLNKFKSTDIEHNLTSMVSMISGSAVTSSIFGANNEVIANGIKKMLDAGEITAEEASQLAYELEDLVDGFKGKLKEVTSPLVKGAIDNATFVTTLIYMDTSLTANLAEVIYGALGLSPKQMFKYFGVFAKEFAKDVTAKLTQVGNKISGGKVPAFEERELSKNIKLLQMTGHYGKMNDIAFNVGANIQTQSKRNMAKLLFKANLIESLTNSVRAARGALASDELNHLVSIIAESPNENDTTRWARDRLSYYRTDPDELVDIYRQVGNISFDTLERMNPGNPLFDRLQKQLGFGITNFIDEFALRPEPGSTARVFDDNRFALFTQFKKFTWNFTTNIVPQLWKMYLKRGKPEYTYSTFSALMVSFAMAYAGLYLRSALRGGEDDEDDEGKLTKRLSQAFGYSLGQAPYDIYESVGRATETYPDGSLKVSPAKTLISQSPAINTLFNSGKDIYNIATEEDDARSKSNLIRRIPVFGEIPSIRNLYKEE